MGLHEHNELRRIDRAIKIEELKEEAAARGEFHDDDYWGLVYDFEYAPWTTDYELLLEEGVQMPPIETFEDDDELTEYLWTIIERLAAMRVYLTSTDHLSDRELYWMLTEDVLHEPRRDVVLDDETSFVYDLVSGGSEEEIYLFFRYYANERDRALWGAEARAMPERIEPPYDRDRFLPGAVYWWTGVGDVRG